MNHVCDHATHFVGADALEAVFRPADEPRARAEPLRQVAADLRPHGALLLDLQDLELLREPIDGKVTQVLGDPAEELDHVLRSAGGHEPCADGVDGAVVHVREVAQGLEREVLDDVSDPGDRHGLVGAPTPKIRQAWSGPWTAPGGRRQRRDAVDLVPVPFHDWTIRS